MMIQGSMAQELTSTLQKQSAKLSEQQAAKLADLLSDYDSDTLNNKAVETIVTQAKELTFISAKDLATALAGAGIDASELAKHAGAAGAGRPKGPPPPPQESRGISTVDDAVVELIAQAVEDYDVSQEEEITLGDAVLAALEEAGYDSTQSQIDFYS